MMAITQRFTDWMVEDGELRSDAEAITQRFTDTTDAEARAPVSGGGLGLRGSTSHLCACAAGAGKRCRGWWRLW